MNDKVMCKLNVFHRGHLRRILGIRWPKVISNEELYKLCDSKPLNETVKRFRWQLFGHCLRLSLDTPAQLAMNYFCDSYSESNIDKGRPITTLPTVLFNEFHLYKQTLKKSTYRQKSSTALRELRKIACNRKDWAKLVNDVCIMVKSKEQSNEVEEL